MLTQGLGDSPLLLLAVLILHLCLEVQESHPMEVHQVHADHIYFEINWGLVDQYPGDPDFPCPEIYNTNLYVRYCYSDRNSFPGVLGHTIIAQQSRYL